jgi:hypothetical protein
MADVFLLCYAIVLQQYLKMNGSGLEWHTKMYMYKCTHMWFNNKLYAVALLWYLTVQGDVKFIIKLLSVMSKLTLPIVRWKKMLFRCVAMIPINSQYLMIFNGSGLEWHTKMYMYKCTHMWFNNKLYAVALLWYLTVQGDVKFIRDIALHMQYIKKFLFQSCMCIV